MLDKTDMDCLKEECVHCHKRIYWEYGKIIEGDGLLYIHILLGLSAKIDATKVDYLKDIFDGKKKFIFICQKCAPEVIDLWSSYKKI